jgi:hypothetical protein
MSPFHNEKSIDSDAQVASSATKSPFHNEKSIDSDTKSIGIEPYEAVSTSEQVASEPESTVSGTSSAVIGLE